MKSRISDWRLKLVSGVSTILVFVIAARLFQVQILRHEYYERKAKAQWIEKVVWHAKRGAVYDRNGSPLVVSFVTYTLGVTPGAFPLNAENLKLLSGVTGIDTRTLRKKLARDCPYIPLARDLNLTEDEIATLSSLPGVRLDPQNDGIYLSDAVPRQLIGSVDFEGKGVSGIELAFDGMLKGTDGWFLRYRDASRRIFTSFNAPYRKPKNGDDIVLTIDGRIQEAVDFELREGIRRYGAKFGVAIVVDPVTGEILALSERSAEEVDGSGEGNHSALYSVSCIYEPGSTFKLITDSFLLENGSVDPDDSFFGENGVAKFDFGVFHDDHKYGWLTFKKSFVYSSNICTIKAVIDADPYEFYKHILKFGFGARTGITLPAESRGTLAPPEKWSKRSMPSIAIGHEIGVTPMQMAMAYAALANDGVLQAPMIVREISDELGNVVREFKPQSVRRVFSGSTARIIKDFCREVVLDGTGKKAFVNGIEVGGKTGTSQKSDGNGYRTGKYVASFIGFAPLDKPRIVCLVMLDEPRFPYNFGGESAAVVFRRIVEWVNQTTDILTAPGAELALQRKDGKPLRVPFLIGKTRAEVFEIAASLGFKLQCEGGEGVVYSQSPDPGAVAVEGSRVTVRVRSAETSKKGYVRVPDVRSMSARTARRLLMSKGLRCEITGFGNVAAQYPGPGRRMRRGGIVTLKCRPVAGIEIVECSSIEGE